MSANPTQNPMATPVPWNMVAEGYAETTMKMLSGYSEEAIAWADLKPHMKVLDVACGPGTLSLMARQKVAEVHAVDFSESMLSLLQERIDRGNITNLLCRQGDGQCLDFRNDQFDAAFSMFGLMFFPDRKKGFAELHRVLKPGGKVAVTSWAPVDRSPAMTTMFGAIRAMNPEIPKPQSVIDSLENPETFERELKEAGFTDIEIRPVTKGFPVESIESFWRDMVKGSAPIVMMKNRMGEGEWQTKEEIALRYLQETIPSVPTSLTSDAWLGTARKCD